MDISNQADQSQQITPEPGQLVEVRRRQWLVVEVSSSQLPTASFQQHSVTLSSIDEDSLGNYLRSSGKLNQGLK
ncbi:hypothetical protein IC615_07250 [Serratia ureilytica]